ncbi:hypothetical protein C8J57DRAFT_1257232 [Mycena rebaudengoi]|nr:hypothetical protein C8J57DRAFT_1257232 [Mycena rebaudengoi]
MKPQAAEELGWGDGRIDMGKDQLVSAHALGGEGPEHQRRDLTHLTGREGAGDGGEEQGRTFLTRGNRRPELREGGPVREYNRRERASAVEIERRDPPVVLLDEETLALRHRWATASARASFHVEGFTDEREPQAQSQRNNQWVYRGKARFLRMVRNGKERNEMRGGRWGRRGTVDVDVDVEDHCMYDTAYPPLCVRASPHLGARAGVGEARKIHGARRQMGAVARCRGRGERSASEDVESRSLVMDRPRRQVEEMAFKKDDDEYHRA